MRNRAIMIRATCRMGSRSTTAQWLNLSQSTMEAMPRHEANMRHGFEWCADRYAARVATGPSPDDELVASLVALRDELERRAVALRSGADVPSGGISFGKRVGEGTNIAIERFTDVAIHDQLVQQLAAVEAALGRVAEGTYGVCAVCGRVIAAERLEAIPWAATCVSCA